MATPLEKARKDPDSMKARILKVARRVFGENGIHGGIAGRVVVVVPTACLWEPLTCIDLSRIVHAAIV
ncbi:MAG: hypothetical protein AB1473_13710 [Thermodesulfobacteriota bacterium]